jgi:hypothetical protein
MRDWKYLTALRVFWATALFGVILTGCTSIRVRANKDPASIRKIKRLFVIVNHGDVDEQTYSHLLADAMLVALTNTAAVFQIEIANPVALDESSYLKQIKQFEADAVLMIRVEGGVLGQYGGYPTLIYDASLFEPDLRKRIWRARIDNSGGTALMKRRMREMADKIVQELRKNGFF